MRSMEPEYWDVEDVLLHHLRGESKESMQMCLSREGLTALLCTRMECSILSVLGCGADPDVKVQGSGVWLSLDCARIAILGRS